ncbi:MAG: DUF1015 domain-containing protein [Acidobacteria bacterium]|nr:DUF1015 domain-containing protein [Acidobacteriota bacterium]
MAKIYPFRSLRYALDKAPIEKVVTQPYDKISEEMQERYYASHPNNIVRIVLGKRTPEDSATNNVYTRAASYLREWRAGGVLEQLPSAGFFVYFQQFTVPNEAATRVRKGFVAVGRLEDYRNKVVFPHERTLTGPKKDRLELLRHTRTHFEQIFMIYEDPERRIDRLLDDAATRQADIRVKDEYGVEHTLWNVTDEETIRLFQRHIDDKKLIIADGHHRYETALAYRDEMSGAAGSDRLPMTFFNMHSPGLAILPTHRVVANIQGFDAKSFWGRAAEYFDVMNSPAEDGVTIGVAADGGLKFLHLKPALDLAALLPDLSPKQRTLDVVVLHRLVLDQCLGITEDAVKKESHITYVREREAAIGAVRDGRAQAAFLLNPTRLDQMRDIAYEGNVMPQKSTDFYPKVLSGLTMYSLD